MQVLVLVSIRVRDGRFGAPTELNPSTQQVRRRVANAVPEIRWGGVALDDADNHALLGTSSLPRGYHWAQYQTHGVGNPEEITKIMIERRLREAWLLGSGGNVEIHDLPKE